MSTEPRRHFGQRLPGGRTNLKHLRSRPGMAWTHVTSALGARADRALFADVAAYCLFIGHARSGSTLVGSLLSAHPEMVIAHELDTLRFVQWHYTRDQLFHLVLRRDAEFDERGRRHGANDYTYVVPDSWQGRFETLRVLGDKKAGASTRKLGDRPELLDRLRRTVGMPIRLIQITRNPFDNISSIARQGKGLDEAANRYFARCDTLAKIHDTTRDGEVSVIKHEDLV
ncbi:MAG: sulfotransferase, partial [Pseudonocardiaceae bacterium]